MFVYEIIFSCLFTEVVLIACLWKYIVCCYFIYEHYFYDKITVNYLINIDSVDDAARLVFGF